MCCGGYRQPFDPAESLHQVAGSARGIFGICYDLTRHIVMQHAGDEFTL
jgi:hypothetical protein